VPFALPSIPINLFWSARFHREPANKWLRAMMVDALLRHFAKSASRVWMLPRRGSRY
jgi:hypothetical protein